MVLSRICCYERQISNVASNGFLCFQFYLFQAALIYGQNDWESYTGLTFRATPWAGWEIWERHIANSALALYV